MIGMNKIVECLKDDSRNYYFVFNFTDGMYYWQFNIDEYNSFYKGEGGRSDRGYVESSSYLFIPVDRLDKIMVN